MKKLAVFGMLGIVVAGISAVPVHAQKKDTLLLMQRLDTMQQMIINMQKTVDTQTAVLRTLVEQANDNVNSMKATVEEMRRASAQNLANNNARFDSMTREIQALSGSLEESQARLAKLSEQLVQTQNIIQTLYTPPPVTDQLEGSEPGGAAVHSVPDAGTLYKSGLSAFNAGQYALAIQSFQEYLQYYAQTDLASNAQFYIGESYYSQGNYEKAIEEYNRCIERYPGGNKAAAAQLKKGYALLAQDRQSSGIRELRSLIQRFPRSREADLARQRLSRLGVSTSARSGN